MIRGVGRRQLMEGGQKNEILKCWDDWSPSANFVPTPLMVGLIPYFGDTCKIIISLDNTKIMAVLFCIQSILS